MNQKIREYLENKVMTATQEELLLLLIDGAISFAEIAKKKIGEKNYFEVNEKLIKAERIMLELICAMKKDGMPEEVYNNLSSLYMFCYWRFVEGNIRKSKNKIDEALKVLQTLREAFKTAVDHMKAGKTAAGSKPGINLQE